MRALVLAALLAGCGQLNRINVGAVIAADATLAEDWRQTQWMTRHQQQGFTEGNPMLGARPSSGAVGIYFASWLTATTASHFLLPRWAQPIVYGAIIGVEAATIRGNIPSTGW